MHAAASVLPCHRTGTSKLIDSCQVSQPRATLSEFEEDPDQDQSGGNQAEPDGHVFCHNCHAAPVVELSPEDCHCPTADLE